MTHSLQPNLAHKRLNADDIRRMFQSAADLLKSNVDLVDRLKHAPDIVCLQALVDEVRL